MSDDDQWEIIDPDRTACLCDVGRPDYWAALAVASDGSEHLVLVERDSLGDESVTYDWTCSSVPHEQLGPLPIEYVRRITVAVRTHRCGRLTGGGRRCRNEVTEPGQACRFHRREQARR